MNQDSSKHEQFDAIVQNVELPAEKFDSIKLSKTTFRFIIFAVPFLLMTQLFTMPVLAILSLMCGALLYFWQHYGLKDSDLMAEEHSALYDAAPRKKYLKFKNIEEPVQANASLNTEEKEQFDNLIKGFYDSPEEK